MDQMLAKFMNLHDYQIQAVDFALNTPKCGLFLKMGLGKSRIALSVIAQLNPACHILLIAPRNIARSSWLGEIRKTGLTIRTKSLLVNKNGKKLSKKKRHELYQELLTAPPTLYLINRDLTCDIVEYFGNRWPFGFVIIDELQSFKNYKSERFKAIKKVMPYVSRFIGLTGTPRPKGLEDLWSEIYLMDGGLRLGPNITAFRNRWFRPGYGLSPQGYPYEWEPLPWAENEIHALISDIVISMKANLGLPPVFYNNVDAYMDADQMKQYREMAKTAVFQYGETEEEVVAALSAAVLQNKLLQMASGCMYVDDKHNYVVIHAAKLEALQYIYDNEPDCLLVAYNFNTDKIMIQNQFPEAVIFDGSQEMQDAWNAKKYRMMLIQPKSSGLGVNIQFGGHTLIWYSLTWSLEDYQQTNARLDRQGQTEPVVIHHILTSGTVDSAVLDRLQEKDAGQEALMEAVRLILQDEEPAAADQAEVN